MASTVGLKALRSAAAAGGITRSCVVMRHVGLASHGSRGMATAASGLSDEQLKAFDRDGFLVVKNHWSRETCNKLMSTMDALIRSWDPDSFTVFTTNEQQRKSDEYFLGSGDKVRYFFEEGAFKDGKLVADRMKSINKVGHALHDLVPEFREVTYTRELGAMCKSLGYERPLVVQSMYIFKQPGIGGEVGAHQDGCFLYTRPATCTGFWWALEDCTLNNGCLWAVPGSHKKVPIKRHFKRTADNLGTEFEPPEAQTYDLTGAVSLEVPAGTLVLLHHSLVHFSYANLSDVSRHAYAVHLVEGGKGVVYPKDNWLQRESGEWNTMPGYPGAKL